VSPAARRFFALALAIALLQAGGARLSSEFSKPLAAQGAAAQRQTRVLALRGATVLTVTKGVIPNGTVLLREGKIAAIGPSSSVDVPAGAG
jgi:hypothetical protein